MDKHINSEERADEDDDEERDEERESFQKRKFLKSANWFLHFFLALFSRLFQWNELPVNIFSV